MNTKGKITKMESKPRISAAALMRLAGFAAILTGLGIVIMGMFHPANVVWLTITVDAALGLPTT